MEFQILDVGFQGYTMKLHTIKAKFKQVSYQTVFTGVKLHNIWMIDVKKLIQVSKCYVKSSR